MTLEKAYEIKASELGAVVDLKVDEREIEPLGPHYLLRHSDCVCGMNGVAGTAKLSAEVLENETLIVEKQNYEQDSHPFTAEPKRHTRAASLAVADLHGTAVGFDQLFHRCQTKPRAARVSRYEGLENRQL